MRIIGVMDGHIATCKPALVLVLHDLSPEQTQQTAAFEVWHLLRSGILHLHSGAQGGLQGTMAGALSRISLRSCALAASLGIKPPQFEPLLYAADYTNGHEAALFYAQNLIDEGQSDMAKSRQIIAQKIQQDKQADATLRRHMAFSFNMLQEQYEDACARIKADIDRLA